MDYGKAAAEILKYVGGKGNVSFATFCATRLRLNLKDKGLIDEEAIRSMEEVFGTRDAGGQYQIIIGQEVGFVYKAFCKAAEISENEGIDEVLDTDIEVKEKLTPKKILNNIMDVISACIAQVMPILTACGLIKLLVSVLGPSMLNIADETSDLLRLLTFVGDAGFYYYPIFLAYGCAKKFKCSIPLALLFSVILIHPSLLEIVSSGEAFSVYGIPMVLNNYTYSFLPILLIVWLMSYVEKFLQRISPKSLKMLVVPLGTTLIMLPVALCVVGPLGTVCGEGISDALVWMSGVFGPVASALIAAMFPFLIVTGMHMPIITIGNISLMQNGFESAIFPASDVCTYTMIAIGLAAVIKARKSEERTINGTSFITLTFGGISEPTLFGIILKNVRAIAYVFIGGLAGGFYIGVTNTVIYIPGPGNLMTILCYGGGETSNLINGIIGCAIGFLVTFILAILFGFETKKKEEAMK